MAGTKKLSSKPNSRKRRREQIFSCPGHVAPNPRLRSLFARIRAGRSFKLSDFARFIARLVQGFEAAAAGGRVLAEREQAALPYFALRALAARL